MSTVNRLVRVFVAMLILASIAQAQSRMTAREIVDRMLSTYASCNSYADEGQASTEFGPRRGATRTFSTFFVRPERFRFALWLAGEQEEVGFIAWKEGAREEFWSTPGRSMTEHDLAKRLAENEAFSGRASVIIPGLLLPHLFAAGSALNQLTDLRLNGEEHLDGRATFIIESKSQDQTIRIWIDQREFLILKIYQREKREIPSTVPMDLTVETTTTYKPRVNVAIPSDQLAFNPPPSSDSAQISGPSNVEIVIFSWSQQIQGGRVLPPSQANPESSAPSALPLPPPDPPSPFPPGGRLPVAYVYSLKVRNVGEKEIRGVTWDYFVIEPETKIEVARSQFHAYVRIKPRGSETLKGIRYSPPSKVISAAGLPDQSPAPEHAEIRCVRYADGSWWKNPEAKTNECESFVRSSVWRRR